MATKKKTPIKKKQPVKKEASKGYIVRAYRIADETHLKLKELAVADDRKIGSKLTSLINDAHAAQFGQKAT